MDAFSSFKYLTDNLPAWIDKLDDLSRRVSERHADFNRLTKLTSGSTTRKTVSTESFQLQNVRQSMTPVTDVSLTPATRIEVDPDSKHLFREFRKERRRKRRPPSMFSAISRLPCTQLRKSLVVYYDSDIQDEFQWLVRHISGARNNLRQESRPATFGIPC